MLQKGGIEADNNQAEHIKVSFAMQELKNIEIRKM
jgi:hypothetical protein